MSHLTPVPSDPDQFQAYFEASRNQPVHLPPPPSDAPVSLTVTVTLLDTEPPVWRRLRIPGEMALDDVHDVLQEAMGWTDSHLHRFHVGVSPRDPYLVTDFDLEEGDDGTPESDVRLDQLLRQPGDAIGYMYDFGDGWEHELRLEEIGPLQDDHRPTCLAGARACPPEDCGGTGAYEELVAWHEAGRTAETVPALPPAAGQPLEGQLDIDADSLQCDEHRLHVGLAGMDLDNEVSQRRLEKL